MNITLTIDVSPALLGVLTAFTDLLSSAVKPELVSEPKAQLATEPTASTSPVVSTEAVAEPETPAEVPAKSETLVNPVDTPIKTEMSTPPESSSYTVGDVKAAVTKKIAEGKRTQVKEVLTDFEAASVVALPKEQYAEFLQRLEAI